MLHLFYFNVSTPPISLADYQHLKVRETVTHISVSLIECRHIKEKAQEAVSPLRTFLAPLLCSVIVCSIFRQKEYSLKEH